MLNVSCFALSVLLVAYALFRAWPDSFLLPVTGSLLILLNYTFLTIHIGAMSEPLFIVLCLLALITMSAYCEKPGSRTLFLCAAFTSLACLCRFAGLALIISGAMAIVIHEKTIARKIRQPLIFVTACCVPLIVWIARNRLLTSHFTDRSLVFHPRLHAQELAWGVSSWFLPLSLPGAGNVVFLLCAAGILAAAFFLQRGRSSRRPELTVYLSFITVYILFGVAIALFFDATVQPSPRYLTPIFPAVMLVALTVWGYFVKHRGRMFRGILLIAFVPLFAFYVPACVRSLAALRLHGQREIKDSLFNARVRDLPLDSLIFSNDIGQVYSYCHRLAAELPVRYSSVRAKEIKGLDKAIRDMGAALAAGNGYAVYYPDEPTRIFAQPGELEAHFFLQLLFEEEGKKLYKIGRQKPG